MYSPQFWLEAVTEGLPVCEGRGMGGVEEHNSLELQPRFPGILNPWLLRVLEPSVQGLLVLLEMVKLFDPPERKLMVNFCPIRLIKSI